jgi:hypothetical protein
MDIENQVVSLELAKRLKELGVEKSGYFCWQTSRGGTSVWGETQRSELEMGGEEFIAWAYTAADLAEMAKPNIIYRNPNAIGKWMASIPSVEGYGETIADALGNLLVKRIQDGLDPKTL